MSSGEIHNIVTLTPREGKLDELVQAFNILSEYIRASEPGTLAYYLVRPQGGNEVVVLEKYSDAEAAMIHVRSENFKEFSKSISQLLDKAPEVKRASFLTGFESRARI